MGAARRLGVVQEDPLGLEQLIATCEAEQGGERVAGRQEGDDEDGKHVLAEPELRVACVEAGEQEVSARVLAAVASPSLRGIDAPSHDHPRRREGNQAPVPGNVIAPRLPVVVDVGVALRPRAHRACGGGMCACLAACFSSVGAR